MARVLLAERDQRIRTFIAGILVEFGHDVVACANSAEANAWLASEPVDVVLTDLVLCGRHGARCGNSWAALGIPTITLSGRAFDGAEAARQRPAPSVDKPFADKPFADKPLADKPFRFADLQCVLDAVALCSQPKAGSSPAIRTAA